MSEGGEKNILTYSFDELGIKDELLRGIYAYGFEKPSNIQNKAIPVINARKDIIAQSQSGTGKTGAFTIGLLNLVDESIKDTQAMIICPTHELVHQCYDVCENLTQYMNISLMKIIGKTSIIECIDGLRKNPQVVIGTPGRIFDMINRKELFTQNIRMFVCDEADEILSQGFKEIIYKIFQFLSKDTQICLFSATMPDDILELTDKFMNDPEKILVNKEELTLEGITQFFIFLKQYGWKYDVLLDLFDTINITQSIIYVNSKNTLNRLYQLLIEKEYPVSYIHGDLTSADRLKNMNDFKSGTTRVMLSTDLLARGIDIQQLSLVINFDIPIQKETYIHRIGRSGRYGRKGVAINFATEKEAIQLKDIESFYNTKIEEMPQNIKDYLTV